MNSAVYRFLTLIAVLSLVSIGTLHGQTAVTGAITGYVSDTSAAAVSDATVEATNTADNVTTTTVTNKDGLYRFPSLIPGSYKVTIKKQGFAEFIREATRLDAGFALRIDASLPVGTVTTKVDVSGQAPTRPNRQRRSQSDHRSKRSKGPPDLWPEHHAVVAVGPRGVHGFGSTRSASRERRPRL